MYLHDLPAGVNGVSGFFCDDGGAGGPPVAVRRAISPAASPCNLDGRSDLGSRDGLPHFRGETAGRLTQPLPHRTVGLGLTRFCLAGPAPAPQREPVAGG